MILWVKRHVEQLNFECIIKLGDFPCRKGFGQSKCPFKTPKMIERRRHHRLLEDIVSTRLKIDVLPISRLLLVQHPLRKELKSLMEVLTGVAILLDWNWHRCVDRFWEVLAEQRLPGSPVLSLEHILKLHKGVNPGEVALFCPFVKLRDHLIDGKFNQLLTIILVDLNSTFVLGIGTLQLVNFGLCLVVIPRLHPSPCRKAEVCRWKPSCYFGRFVWLSVLVHLLLTFLVIMHFQFAVESITFHAI